MDDFDLAGFDVQDEASLVIRNPKTKAPTTWMWTFYGPAHPRTVDLAERATREVLAERAEQRRARANGEEWIEKEVRTPDQIRARTVADIVARTKTFTPVKLDGAEITFSAEAVTALLTDRRKNWLLDQIVEFLKAEENFIQPSAPS